MSRRAAALAAALLAADGLAKNADRPGGAGGWRMAHHSFDRTLTYDDHLGEWLTSASTMALRDRVQLLPSVPDRYGLLWSKKAIDTKDFEVRFTMSATDNGENKGTFQDGAIAFWLMPDNFATKYDEQAIVTDKSKDWYKGLQLEGLTLLSNRPRFEGLAMVFMNSPRQSVVGLWSDGSQAINSVGELADKALPEHRRDMDWMTAGTQVRVAVKPDGSIVGSVMTLDVQKHLAGSRWGWAPDGETKAFMVSFQADGKLLRDDKPFGTWSMMSGSRVKITMDKASYVLRFEGSHRAVVEDPTSRQVPALLYGGKNVGAPDSDWQVVFRLPPKTFPARSQAFIGFSGYTGTKSYIEVDLHRLSTKNFDAKTIGEDESDVLEESIEEWMKVLEQEKRYVSQATQAEAVVKLTNLLTKYVDRFDKDGQKIQSELGNMEVTLDTIGTDISNYLAAAQAFSFDSNVFDHEEVRGHIHSIRSVLAKNKDLHDSKINVVHQTVKELKASGGRGMSSENRLKVEGAAHQTQLLEEHASRGSSLTYFLLFVIVGSVAGLGFLFLSRMRYYEKKHYI